MALPKCTTVRRPICTLVAGAVVFAALAATTAGASAQSPAVDSRPAFCSTEALTARSTRRTLVLRELAPFGINDRGQIVGELRSTPASEQRLPAGQRTAGSPRFDVPGARATQAPRSTIAARSWASTARTPPLVSDPSARRRGFLLDRGRFTRIDVPGAAQTQAIGINDRGQVVGEYLDADGMVHGFLWDKGRFTTIDVPGATGASSTDINDRGQIVGVYGDDPAGRRQARTAFC